MRYFEAKFNAELFIHADNSEECETVLRHIVAEAGFFNVEVTVQEVAEPMTLAKLNDIYEKYELDIKEL